MHALSLVESVKGAFATLNDASVLLSQVTCKSSVLEQWGVHV